MFYLSWLYGLIGTLILLGVFVYLVVMAPARNWGEVTQAIMFHQVRKYLLMLDTNKLHSKFWRPNVLLVIDNPAAALLGFCNNIKKGGLLLIGQAVIGNYTDAIRLSKSLKQAWNLFLKSYKIKGFTQLTVDPDYRRAVQSMLLGSGLGGMTSNTVCLPILSASDNVKRPMHDRDAHVDAVTAFLNQPPTAQNTHSDLVSKTDGLPVQSFSDYCGIIHDVLQYEHNVMLACNFQDGIHTHKNQTKVSFTSSKKYTDIWIVGDFAIVNDPAGTLHSLWGYTTSPYHSHIAHPFLIIPEPLEASDGVYVEDNQSAPGMEGLSALILQLGAIADQTRVGLDGKRLNQSHSLRIMHVPSSTSGSLDAIEERTTATKFIKEALDRARLKVQDENIHIFMLHDVMDQVAEYRTECDKLGGSPAALQTLSPEALARVVNQLMLRNSGVDTALILTALPFPVVSFDERDAELYVRRLNTLTSGLPPTLLVCNGEDVPFISTSL
jgi:hypothetical protein